MKGLSSGLWVPASAQGTPRLLAPQWDPCPPQPPPLSERLLQQHSQHFYSSVSCWFFHSSQPRSVGYHFPFAAGLGGTSCFQ